MATPKKTTAKKRSAKSTKAKTTKKPVHSTHNAKSAVAWAVLGLVAITFTLWILQQNSDLLDTYNEVDVTESAAPRASEYAPAESQ